MTDSTDSPTTSGAAASLADLIPPMPAGDGEPLTDPDGIVRRLDEILGIAAVIPKPAAEGGAPVSVDAAVPDAEVSAVAALATRPGADVGTEFVRAHAAAILPRLRSTRAIVAELIQIAGPAPDPVPAPVAAEASDEDAEVPDDGSLWRIAQVVEQQRDPLPETRRQHAIKRLEEYLAQARTEAHERGMPPFDPGALPECASWLADQRATPSADRAWIWAPAVLLDANRAIPAALERLADPAAPAAETTAIGRGLALRLRPALPLLTYAEPAYAPDAAFGAHAADVRSALLAAIGDKKGNARLHEFALEILATMPGDDLRKPLRKALQTRRRDPFVRGGAARVLATLGDPDAVRDLLESLVEGNPQIRVRVIEALGHAGTDAIEGAVDPLSRLLHAPYEETDARSAAALSLAGIARHEDTPDEAAMTAASAVFSALEDPDPRIRHAAVLALATLDGEPVWQALRGVAAEEPVAIIVESALHALAGLEAAHDPAGIWLEILGDAIGRDSEEDGEDEDPGAADDGSVPLGAWLDEAFGGDGAESGDDADDDDGMDWLPEEASNPEFAEYHGVDRAAGEAPGEGMFGEAYEVPRDDPDAVEDRREIALQALAEVARNAPDGVTIPEDLLAAMRERDQEARPDSAWEWLPLLLAIGDPAVPDLAEAVLQPASTAPQPAPIAVETLLRAWAATRGLVEIPLAWVNRWATDRIDEPSLSATIVRSTSDQSAARLRQIAQLPLLRWDTAPHRAAKALAAHEGAGGIG